METQTKPKQNIEDFTQKELLQFAKDSKANNKYQQKKIEGLQEFSQWLTGCGYDFCQHEYFIKNRHILSA